MKIGLWGWYGFRNCGDDILLWNLLSYLDTRNEITAFGDADNLRRLSAPYGIVTARRSPWNLFRFSLTGDVLIIGPGGLFPFDNPPKLLFYSLITAVMRLRRKQAAYIGVGVGTPTLERKFNLRVLNGITGNASAFLSRSANYLQFAPTLKINQIELSADALFSDERLSECAAEQEPDLVVMSLADIFDGLPSDALERFLTEFIPFARRVLDCGFRVRLIPFTNEKDQSIHDRVAALIQDNRLVSVPFHENPYETFRELSRGSFCVGMRFHALVMSFINHTPCLSVSYADKHLDLMERFGLGEYSTPYAPTGSRYFRREIPLNGQELWEKFDALRRNQERLRELIASRLPEMRSLSRKNRDAIAALWNKS